ncbi:MAG: type II secretion system GspH family protein [Lentisphaeraceae bacterium]|nr:type II secretion system GspH family protein [Lentisphaeraceae bacterium]
MKRNAKFSMIEVMVVLAITASLLSVLFTSMQASKDVTLKATCMSNISQIRNYVELYRKDNGNLPYTDIWLTDFSWSEPYTSSEALDVFNCPGDEDAPKLTSFSQLRYNTSYYYVPSAVQLEKNIADGLAFGIDTSDIPDIAASQDGVIYDKSADHHNGSINIAFLFKSDDPDFQGESERGTIASLNDTSELLAVLDDGTVEVPDLTDEVYQVVEETAEEEIDDTVDFDIDDGVVTINEPATATYRILGAAISYGSYYDMPVTTKMGFSEPDGNYDIVEPFGSYGSPTGGNVNGTSAQDISTPKVYPAGTEMTSVGKSWKKYSTRSDGEEDSDWKQYMEVDSTHSSNVMALRNGDSVPDISGFMDQGNIESFLAGYIVDGKVNLDKNQVIYLYELGTTNLSSPSADFQDLVVLVTLAPASASGAAGGSGN